MTAEGLETFHRELIGLGYVPAFQGAKKRMRSTRDGVSVEVILAGEYPAVCEQYLQLCRAVEEARQTDEEQQP
jgi:hypothetical protein